MEGDIYLCKWELEDGRYRLHLTKHPRLRSESEVFEDAAEELCAQICMEFGDGEAVLEYAKPPPVTHDLADFATPELVSLGGNDAVGEIANRESCVRSTTCKSCERSRHQRFGDERLILLQQPESDIAFGKGVELYSEAFLANLDPATLSRYEVRECVKPPRARRRYFEIIGEPLVTKVGVRSFPGIVNTKCRTCGINCFTYLFDCELYTFVAADQLPDELPQFFLVGDELQELDLVMPRAHYERFQGGHGTRGVSSSRLWVAPGGRYITDNDQEGPHPS